MLQGWAGVLAGRGANVGKTASWIPLLLLNCEDQGQKARYSQEQKANKKPAGNKQEGGSCLLHLSLLQVCEATYGGSLQSINVVCRVSGSASNITEWKVAE